MPQKIQTFGFSATRIPLIVFTPNKGITAKCVEEIQQLLCVKVMI
jgi:hypothetical protein